MKEGRKETKEFGFEEEKIPNEVLLEVSVAVSTKCNVSDGGVTKMFVYEPLGTTGMLIFQMKCTRSGVPESRNIDRNVECWNVVIHSINV